MPTFFWIRVVIKYITCLLGFIPNLNLISTLPLSSAKQMVKFWAGKPWYGDLPLLSSWNLPPPSAPQPHSALRLPNFHVSFLSEHLIGNLSYVFLKLGYQMFTELHFIPACLANLIFKKIKRNSGPWLVVFFLLAVLQPYLQLEPSSWPYLFKRGVSRGRYP